MTQKERLYESKVNHRYILRSQVVTDFSSKNVIDYLSKTVDNFSCFRIRLSLSFFGL